MLSHIQKYRKQYRLKNLEHIRRLARLKASKDRKKDPARYYARVTEAIKNWRAKYPGKYRAHAKVFTALRNGSLVKKPCHCGKTRVQAHHTDYRKPLKVDWYCVSHHAEVHNKKREAVYNSKPSSLKPIQTAISTIPL